MYYDYVCLMIGADFLAQISQSHMVGLVNTNIYCAHEGKNKITERLHSFKRSKKKITTAYKNMHKLV